jgi:hypothetical protein
VLALPDLEHAKSAVLSSLTSRSGQIARCFLAGAGMTIPGEMARVTGLPRPEAGRGNLALVAEGYATMPASGVYQLAARHAVQETGCSTNRGVIAAQ